MYRSDLLADIAVRRPDLFENIPGSSNTSMQESTHMDMISPPEYPTTADSDVPKFNTGNDTAFTPAPTTLMGSFIAQSNYTYPGCEALFSTNSLATQSVSDPRGMGVSSHVVNLAAVTPFTNAMPSLSSGYSSEAGVGAPGYGANFSGSTTWYHIPSCIRSNELAVDIRWKGLLPGPFQETSRPTWQ
jgi:hypothetical protein